MSCFRCANGLLLSDNINCVGLFHVVHRYRQVHMYLIINTETKTTCVDLPSDCNFTLFGLPYVLH